MLLSSSFRSAAAGSRAASSSRPATTSRSSIISHAKPTKAADFRGLDNTEVVAKIDELKKEKLRLQYMQKTRGNILNPGSEQNPEAVQVQPSEFVHVKRQIGQLMTILRERELADGITRKQSRGLRKEVAVAAGLGRL